MNVLAFSSPRHPDWRWRIVDYGGVTIEENIEQALGTLNGHDWRWRKARHAKEMARPR